MEKIAQAKDKCRTPRLAETNVCLFTLRSVKILSKEHTYKGLAAEARVQKAKRKSTEEVENEPEDGDPPKEVKATGKAKAKAKAKGKGRATKKSKTD